MCDNKINKSDVEIFINKIQRQSGFVDVIDAYKLISHYVDIFGIKYMDKLDIEEELMCYYEELKSYIKGGDTMILRKKCNGCKEVKPINEYSKRNDGYEYKCKGCIKIYSDKRKEYRKNIKNKLEI